MKKQTDFAMMLNRFFMDYLPNKKGCSPQTIDSYRYAFIHLLTYYEQRLGIKPERLTLTEMTYERISDYLGWLEETLHVAISTRNQRQSALNSFIHYLIYVHPEYLHEYQRILSIPIKQSPQQQIAYLKADGVSALMQAVDTSSTNGLRDYIILMLLYSTGIRVSELIHLRIRDVSLHPPYTLLVHGKGNKSRYVPLLKEAAMILQKYIGKYRSPVIDTNNWLFINHMKEPFTRQGINYLMKKYGNLARKNHPDLIPENLSPHKMRHTAAMELVNAGVDLIYIRDMLGHVSVKTTEIYARADAKRKREAIEAASKEIVPPEEAVWDMNDDLKSWLKAFNQR